MLTEATQQGKVFYEDILSTLDICFNLHPTLYSEALVYGIQMKSRGYDCVEKTGEKSPQLDCNDLTKSWLEKKSISSWFKYHRPFNSAIDLENMADNYFGFNNYTFDRFYYGQFNYFFRLTLPEERLLNGLPMAAVTCRKPSIDHYIDVIKTDNSSYDPTRFVVLTNVCSTRILIGARDNEKKPMCIKNDFNQQNSETTNRAEYLSKQPKDKVADLFILELDPHRKSVVYDKLNKNYYKHERDND